MKDNLLNNLLTALTDLKGEDIVYFNTKAKTPLFDWIVIATAKSDVHAKSLAAKLTHELKDSGFKRSIFKGTKNGQWVIADFSDIVVHIMLSEIRQTYNLEEIWQ